MADIVLLHPPNINEPSLDAAIPHLGLFYLYSFLSSRGYEAEINNLYECQSWTDVKEHVSQLKASVVGIPCFTEQRKSSFELARICKHEIPGTTVVMGGPHATFLHRQVLERYSFIDYVVKGEGEEVLGQLLQQIISRNPPQKESIKGIAYQESGRIFNNANEGRISDLDGLPFPFRDGKYIKQYSAIPRLEIHFRTTTSREGDLMVPILTSRGCAIGCTFCCPAAFWGRSQRFRSPNNILKEIRQLHYENDVRLFDFLDDNFTADQDRVAELCHLILNEGLDIKWWCSGRIESADTELFKLMKDAGCFLISFGMESGSNKVLRSIGKQISADEIIRAGFLAHEANLPFRLTVTVGNLGDNDATIDDTISLLRTIRPRQIGLFLVELFPGTPLYKIAKRRGFVNDDYWFQPSSEPFLFNLMEHSLDTLLEFRDRIVNSLWETILDIEEDVNHDINIILKETSTR